ncbi:MAG: bacteriohemerythrin [Sulfuritalea sp.]|nr:bacteriohemerythrin [Sulfuritalea sp.]
MSTPSNSQGRENFEIGIAEIDLQHRQINDLLQRLKHSADKQYAYAASTILGELVMQTRIHFAVEESLMRLLSFPDTDAHVAEHRHLMEKLEKFKQRAQDFDVADGLSDFIQTWLLGHLDNYDRKFVAHFISRGIDPLAAPKSD